MAKKPAAEPPKSGGGKGNDGGGGDGGALPVEADASLEAEARRRYLNYALSVITSRALPDVRDGLKPVQRRILYGMLHDEYLRPDAKHKKSAKVVGTVMGKYHPHGDSAIYDAMVRMAQDWSLRVPLVDGCLGLGLAIVKNLVELHGGTVSARSEGVGKGAELEVLLPLARHSAPMPVVVEPVGEARTRHRILIVDDNRDAATMLSEVLDSYGHDIQLAFDGPSALALAGRAAPEIAILDIGLPVMDGYELARQLRALAPVRLIALTGYGQTSDRERVRAAGFEAHLAKPIAIEKLLALLDQDQVTSTA